MPAIASAVAGRDDVRTAGETAAEFLVRNARARTRRALVVRCGGGYESAMSPWNPSCNIVPAPLPLSCQ
jgi:hypothetical protein